MSYGATHSAFGTDKTARGIPLKFSWQSETRNADNEIPADYIVHKMRGALRPEIGLARLELRIIRALEVFLFIVFFPLGFALNRYNKVFGPSIAMTTVVFLGWWSTVLMLLHYQI